MNLYTRTQTTNDQNDEVYFFFKEVSYAHQGCTEYSNIVKYYQHLRLFSYMNIF